MHKHTFIAVPQIGLYLFRIKGIEHRLVPHVGRGVCSPCKAFNVLLERLVAASSGDHLSSSDTFLMTAISRLSHTELLAKRIVRWICWDPFWSVVTVVRSLILPFPAFTLHAMYTWIHGVFISDWKGEAISASLSGEGRLTANPTSLAVVFMDYFVWILPFPEFRQPLRSTQVGSRHELRLQCHWIDPYLRHTVLGVWMVKDTIIFKRAGLRTLTY